KDGELPHPKKSCDSRAHVLRHHFLKGIRQIATDEGHNLGDMGICRIVKHDHAAIIEKPRAIESIEKDVLEQMSAIDVNQIIALAGFEQPGQDEFRKLRSIIQKLVEPRSLDSKNAGFIIPVARLEGINPRVLFCSGSTQFLVLRAKH